MGVAARLLKHELLIHVDYGLALAWLTDVQPLRAMDERREQPHIACGAADLTPAERTTLERLGHRIQGVVWAHYQGPVGE
jgi:hypothetical protein